MLALLTPVLLAASGKKWDPLAFDPGIVFWTWVVFGCVVLVLAKFAWRPLVEALEQRENQIKDGMAEADAARAEAQKIAADFEESRKSARAEASRLADEARTNAARLKAELEAEAREQADAVRTQAKEEIALARQQALEEVRNEAVRLSLAAAEALLKKNLDDADNRQLAEKVIGEVGAAGGGS